MVQTPSQKTLLAAAATADTAAALKAVTQPSTAMTAVTVARLSLQRARSPPHHVWIDALQPSAPAAQTPTKQGPAARRRSTACQQSRCPRGLLLHSRRPSRKRALAGVVVQQEACRQSLNQMAS